jgi:hypothetical protein
LHDVADNQPHYFDPRWIEPTGERLNVDICIYGGTSAGIMAAVVAMRRGKSVVLLHPGKHIGGMTTGGLGYTDIGRAEAAGGLTRQFYRDIGAHYGVEETYKFEPHVAADVYDRWLADTSVDLRRGQFLHRAVCEHGRITRVEMLGGLMVSAKVFIDATYEGDLMAYAGVSYTIGRESNDTYGETLNGVQLREQHQFDCPVDPFIKEGDSTSGYLPNVNPRDAMPDGRGDHRVQAYCFRMCMTKREDNRVPFPKPEGYDPLQYVLGTRWLKGTQDDVFAKFDRIPNDKTDTNNRGAFSTDYIERERIFQQHVTYQMGLHWFMANDSTVPDAIRDEYATWGLAKDEFVETGHWPHHIYVREGRRMIGDYVLTEDDCTGRRVCDDIVAYGSYGMDSHNCQRLVRDGKVLNEGDVQVGLSAPYAVSYRCIVPKRGEVANLVVPVAASASHIAFGSLRMEPVFMMLGESAAIAACMAIDRGRAMQDVAYAKLRQALEDAGQVVRL